LQKHTIRQNAIIDGIGWNKFQSALKNGRFVSTTYLSNHLRHIKVFETRELLTISLRKIHASLSPSDVRKLIKAPFYIAVPDIL